MDDLALMTLLAQGDDRGLSLLYDRYGVAAYSLAYRILGTRESAEEITQDVFMTIWKQPQKWDPARGKLSSWLLTITRNRAIDRLRREQRAAPLAGTPVDEMPHLTSTESQTRSSLWEDGQLLMALLERLPDTQASIIEQAYYQGKTLRSIAEASDTPLSTVKSRMRAGLQTLRGLWLAETQSAPSANTPEG